MKLLRLLALLGLLCGFCLSASGQQVVTLVTPKRPAGGPTTSDEITINSDQSVTFRMFWGYDQGVTNNNDVRITRDGVFLARWKVEHFTEGDPAYIKEKVLAGPLEIKIQNYSFSSPWLLTLEIQPSQFAPDKTLILPEGTVGTVHVESSTNLIDWQDEWSQTFANTNDNRFFRLRAERMNP